ncbi:MAG: DUF1858 domain-containing protein [Bryobacterales bacterium]|nr:DUF1858 domain-containing protein [Bryobacterales bacterium]
MSLVITPQTKVGELLDAYPGIEESLIEWVPAFRKLRNPILRRTVAKVATLDQAARIGGISARELVLKLRQATGQTIEGAIASESSASSAPDLHASPGAGEQAPSWVSTNRLHTVLDAEVLLDGGEHPLGKTQAIVARLSRDEMLRIDSSFRPAPLIDLFEKNGLRVYSHEPEPGRHQTWLAKP